MFSGNKELIRHMMDEISFVITHTNGKDKNEVINDEVLCRAVVRSIEIIGEAAKKIDPDFKAMHSQIEWKKISRTRDKLIHEYFGIDYDIVWDIISIKLPELKQFFADIINTEK